MSNYARTHQIARDVIAQFIAEEVLRWVNATPTDEVKEQADAIIERLADEGLYIADAMPESRS